MPDWVFCSETGGLLDPDNVRHRAFLPLLRAEGLPGSISRPRAYLCLTITSKQRGTVYVIEQMGHSSIQVTVDLYGHLIPGGTAKPSTDWMTWIGHGMGYRPATPAQPEVAGHRANADNPLNIWCARQELNLRPAGSKPDALSN